LTLINVQLTYGALKARKAHAFKRSCCEILDAGGSICTRVRITEVCVYFTISPPIALCTVAGIVSYKIKAGGIVHAWVRNTVIDVILAKLTRESI